MIEKLKFVNIVGPLTSLDELSQKLIKESCFHIENAAELTAAVKGFSPIASENLYSEPLMLCTELLHKLGIPLSAPNDNPLEFGKLMPYLKELNSSYIELSVRLELLKNDYLSNEQIIKQVLPIMNLKVPLGKIYSLEHIKFRFGRLTKENYDKLMAGITGEEPFIFVPSTLEKEYVWGMYFAPRIYIKQADGTFASLHFERIRISDRADGIPSEVYERLSSEEKEIDAEIKSLEEQRLSLIKTNKQKLQEIYAALTFRNAVHESQSRGVKTAKNFYFAGWVPAHQLNALKQRIGEVPGISCISEDPFSDDKLPIPPTKLKNKSLFAPFETFVTMYGLPKYGEIDPTPIVAITYSIFFGLMFGDVGQGLVLFIVGMLLYLIKKIPFGKLIATVGVFATAGGFLYGSVFGAEMLPGIKPLESTEDFNITMVGAVAIGVVIIVVVMALNVINGLRKRNFGNSLFSHNGIAGMVFYISIIVGVLSLFAFGKSLWSIPYILAFVVLPLLLIFFHEPLGRLVAGRKKIMTTGFGDYVLENFFELFEIMLSYITNTISFVRIGAFALTHAGMMMFVYIVARLAGSTGNIIVIVIGNIIVMCLEGLIVGIQVLRLEFYEMFGRFFSGEGRAFTPADSALINDKHN